MLSCPAKAGHPVSTGHKIRHVGAPAYNWRLLDCPPSRPMTCLGFCSSLSHRREDVREFRLELRAQVTAHVDHGRERALELHVVRNAGVDQDAVVEVTGQIERIALGGPGLLDQ